MVHPDYELNINPEFAKQKEYAGKGLYLVMVVYENKEIMRDVVNRNEIIGEFEVMPSPRNTNVQINGETGRYRAFVLSNKSVREINLSSTVGVTVVCKPLDSKETELPAEGMIIDINIDQTPDDTVAYREKWGYSPYAWMSVIDADKW